MNVPTKYKGFSKLPELVQQRMSPELAEKYNMGGAVMDRPLFRQMGGDVAPVPPAPAMPEEAAEGIMSAEMGMRDKAQMMAQDYLANTEQRLDMAESPEEVINAIRGNDRPVEDRYRELASYVGEQDAMQTPESVLAMVQPTLMLTEEGALDSGIGDLVKNLAGDIEMETSEGDATAMGGGLGSLMMAGAGNTPPENFSQGGAVRLANGGEVRPYYDARLPIYQEIMGGGDDAKRMSQAQALFAISDAAGRFASGVGAQGQDVRGLSPAAQLAAATTGLGTQLGAIGAQTDQLDRQARLAALTAAESDLARDQAAAQAAANKPLGKIYDVLDEDGKVLFSTPLSTAQDLEKLRKEYPNASIRESKEVKPKFQEFNGDLYRTDTLVPQLVIKGVKDKKLQELNGVLLDVTDPSNIVKVYGEEDRETTVINNTLIDYTDPDNVKVVYSDPSTKTTTVGNVVLDITDPDNVKEIFKGEEPRKTTTIGGQLIDYTDKNNVVVLFGDKERKYKTSNGNIIDVTDPENIVTVFKAEQKPDIRIIDGDAIDFSDVNNPKVLYSSPDEDKTTVIDGVLLDISDLNDIKTLYQKTPDQKTVTIGGQLIDFTDPNNIKVLFGNKERKYKTSDGNIVDITDPQNPQVIYEAVQDAVNYQLPNGNTKSVRKGSPEENKLLEQGAKRVSITKTDYSLLEDVDLMSQYASGDENLSADKVAQIQRAINDLIKPEPGATVSAPVPPIVENAEKLRASLGLSTTMRFPPPQPIDTADNSALEKFGEAAFGTAAFFRNMVNLGAGLLDISAPAEQTETALTELNTLNESAKIAFRNIVPGRSQEAVNQFATTLPKGKALTGTKQKAAKEVQALITLFRREVDKAQGDLTTIVDPSERASAENAILQSEAIIQAYEALLVGIKGGKKVGADISKFDKRKTDTTEK